MSTLDDLVELRDCLFSTDERRNEGLSKVKAYQARGSIPHPVECTAFLFSVISSDNDSSDSYVVRLSYSMALVRLVNGYVDNYQQGQSPMPVYHTAKAIGIPSHFVELRHTATHDSLPSLELLRDVSRQALQWLWNNYWDSLERNFTANAVGGSVEPENSPSEKKTLHKAQNSIKKIFTSWRRLRKGDPDGVVDMREQEVVDVIENLRNYLLANEEDLTNVLFEKSILIPKADPIERRAALYGPLFNQLFGQGFIERLVIKMSNIISALANEIMLDENRPEPLYTTEARAEKAHTIESLFYWIQYFFTPSSSPPSLEYDWLSSPEVILKYFIDHPQPWNVIILQKSVKFYKDKLGAENLSLVQDLVDLFESSKQGTSQSTVSIDVLEKQLSIFREDMTNELRRQPKSTQARKQHSKTTGGHETCGWVLQYN